MPLRWLPCSLRLPPSLPALSGRRDGESCPVGPHRHGRGCCRRQNVSTDVPCVCNVIGGMWPRGLDSLGNQRLDRVPAFLNSGQKALRVIQALRSLNLHPAPGSMILLRGWPYRSDPFSSNGWNTVFIASLVYNDHSLRIYHEGTNQLTQQEIAKMDYIILVDEFHAELKPSPTAVGVGIPPAR